MGAKRAIELTARIDATLATLMFLIGALEDEVGKIVPVEGADETEIPDVLTENGEDG
jgi:hypothetical protein